MAEQTDCEGNIISPLGIFKKLSCVSSASDVSLPQPVCSSALTTSTTVSYSTRMHFTLTSPTSSLAPVISVTGSAKPPVTGGVRGYEYVSVDDLTMIYRGAVKIKMERDLVQKENEKLKKMMKSWQRKEKSKQLPPTCPAPAMTRNIATQADSDTAPVSPLTSCWHSLFLQLRAHSSTELQKGRATIATQAKQMVDKEREIKRLTIKVATLTHDNNQAHLALQQNLSVASPSITGSVLDSTTSDVDPAVEVGTPEPALAQAPRADLLRRGDDTIQISQMLDTVDRLAKQYSPSDRYHQPNVTNLSQSRSVVTVTPDNMFNYELAALWMFAKDPTEDEIVEYDRLLEKELRPPPIYSPRLKKPAVNWNRLNPGQLRNLPKAECFPVQGCSQDESFYLNTITDGIYPHLRTFFKWERTRFPFGGRFGFPTNKGIVAVPDMPIHGYRCCEYTGEWMIDATMEY